MYLFADLLNKLDINLYYKKRQKYLYNHRYLSLILLYINDYKKHYFDIFIFPNDFELFKKFLKKSKLILL